MAMEDVLTGLANRSAFILRMDRFLAELRSKIVGLVVAGPTKLVGVLQAPARQMIGVTKAYGEKA